jgi:CRP-like cAMP-binding protein
MPRAAERTRSRLAAAAATREARPGVIFRAGEAVDLCVLVLAGHAAMTMTSRDGRTALIRVVGAGEFVGLPNPLGLEALDEVSLAVWPSVQFAEASGDDPAVWRDLVNVVAGRERDAVALLGLVTFETARARLALFLLRYEHLAFASERPPLSRSKLAGLAGVSAQMARRILRAWEDAGIMRRVGKGGLVLVDRGALGAQAAAMTDYGESVASPWSLSSAGAATD